MANPQVRPYLKFFPEDSGNLLENANQGQQWLRDMDPELLTPSFCQYNQEFFIFEPAILKSQTVVMPFRLFTRDARLYALCWLMSPVMSSEASGWLICKFEKKVIPTSNFVSSFSFFLRKLSTARAS